MFAEDEVNDPMSGKCPSAELARGSSGSLCPLSAGRLDPYHGSCCPGFIRLAALADLLKVITAPPPRPWTSSLQRDSRGISVLCPQPRQPSKVEIPSASDRNIHPHPIWTFPAQSYMRGKWNPANRHARAGDLTPFPSPAH